MTLTKAEIRTIIARRVAQEFKDGDIVTLGIGLPTEASNFIPDSVHVTFQTENGIIGVGATPTAENYDERITNSGGGIVSIVSGGAFFDSVSSFGMIRGGHINATVLGALQVDESGNLANWVVPGQFLPGMGGAMDLVVGAQQMIVAMEHTTKGEAKILKACTLPLTAAGEVNTIITEKGVFRYTPEGLVLTEISSISNLEDIRATTKADFKVGTDLKVNAY